MHGLRLDVQGVKPPTPFGIRMATGGFWASLVCFGVMSIPASARLGAYPDFDIFDKTSEVVVIAEPLGSRDLAESFTLENIRPPIKTIGVETRFKVLSTLRGEMAGKEFTLHHYRLPNPVEARRMISGPGLVSFPFAYEQVLMFLNKDSLGRYRPASGQTDPSSSIRPIANRHWGDLQRGWIFMPSKSWLWQGLAFTLAILAVALLNYWLYKKALDKLSSRPTQEPDESKQKAKGAPKAGGKAT